jgi:hypothetical protein
MQLLGAALVPSRSIRDYGVAKGALRVGDCYSSGANATTVSSPDFDSGCGQGRDW